MAMPLDRLMCAVFSLLDKSSVARRLAARSLRITKPVVVDTLPRRNNQRETQRQGGPKKINRICC